MTNRNQIVGLCNWVTEPEIGKPKSRSAITGVNLAEPNESLMYYLGRSWTSFVVLASKKSAAVILVEANPVKNFRKEEVEKNETGEASHEGPNLPIQEAAKKMRKSLRRKSQGK